MALERRDPVPPGRYSLFVNASETSQWAAWTSAHKGAVVVLASVARYRIPGSTSGWLDPLFSTTPTGGIVKELAGNLVLFEVKSPVAWVGLGLPTIETVTPSGFTAREADVGEPDQSPFDSLANAAKAGSSLLWIAGAGALVFLLLGRAAR